MRRLLPWTGTFRVFTFCDVRVTLENDFPVTKVAKKGGGTTYKRWSCHSGDKLLCKLCRNLLPPAMGARFTVFLGKPAMRTLWSAGAALHKSVDVETNPCPTTSHKQVWICDICHKQIHVRKQISIRCNRFEHWVHLRCADIRQAQHTDTWTCHLHRESGLTTHTYITSSLQTMVQTT